MAKDSVNERKKLPSFWEYFMAERRAEEAEVLPDYDNSINRVDKKDRDGIEALVNFHKQREEKFFREAYTDSLTGLLNKRAYQYHINKVVKEGHNDVYILMLDIDHFKWVNDTQGHDVGDKVLSAVGEAVEDGTREHQAFRFGGEEIVAVVDAESYKDALQVAQRLNEGIPKSIYTNPNLKGFRMRDPKGRFMPFTVSVGLARLEPGESAEDAFKRADESLYGVKNNGRNGIAYSPGIGKEPIIYTPDKH